MTTASLRSFATTRTRGFVTTLATLPVLTNKRKIGSATFCFAGITMIAPSSIIEVFSATKALSS
jgi:hypothetical protein